MTRIVGKIYENTKENKEKKGAASGSGPPGRCRAPEVLFFDFLSILVCRLFRLYHRHVLHVFSYGFKQF